MESSDQLVLDDCSMDEPDVALVGEYVDHLSNVAKQSWALNILAKVG